MDFSWPNVEIRSENNQWLTIILIMGMMDGGELATNVKIVTSQYVAS